MSGVDDWMENYRDKEARHLLTKLAASTLTYIKDPGQPVQKLVFSAWPKIQTSPFISSAFSVHSSRTQR